MKRLAKKHTVFLPGELGDPGREHKPEECHQQLAVFSNRKVSLAAQFLHSTATLGYERRSLYKDRAK